MIDLSTRFVFHPTVISTDLIIPPNSMFYISPLLEIGVGITLEVSVGSYLEIG